MMQEIREKLKDESGEERLDRAVDALVGDDNAPDDGDERQVFGIESLEILQDVPETLDAADKAKLEQLWWHPTSSWSKRLPLLT